MKKILLPLFISFFLYVPIYGGIIDDMDSTSGWDTNKDDNTNISVSVDSTQTDKSLKVEYSFTAGEWVEVGKDFSYFDISAGDRIKFYYKGSGAANDLQIQMVDSDGSVITDKISGVSNQPNWTELSLSFSGIGADIRYDWGGDSYFDKTRVEKINFGVVGNSGYEGTLAIDNVRLFLDTPETLMLDDFEDLNVIAINEFGGAIGAGGENGGSCVDAYISTVTYDNTAGALELKYNVTNSGAYSWYYSQLNSTDVSNTSHLSMKVKSSVGGERFKIELSTNTIYVYSANYIAVTTSWQELVIPLADFHGFVSSSATGSLTIVFENTQGGVLAGTLYVDEIKFFQSGEPNSIIKTIDSMDSDVYSSGEWQPCGRYTGFLRSVSGASGLDYDKAIEFSYKFSQDKSLISQWVVMERNSYINVTDASMFRFKFKGSGGDDNLEFKVSDQNSNVFRKIFYQATDTGDQWRTFEVPFNELGFFSGATEYIDLTKLKSIWFAVSRNKGSSGVIYLNDLEYLTPQINQMTDGEFLINLDVYNNPFSPNGDGLKDRVIFRYKLSDSAKIKLEIFTLKGTNVYSYEEEGLSDGNEHTVEWDGYDKNNSRVSNGLYIYKFTVKGYNGKEDKVTHIIGVIR